MIRVVRPVFESALSFFVVLTFTFFLIRTLPGSPFDQDFSNSKDLQNSFEKAHGLQGSALAQYGHYVSRVLWGDFGISPIHQVPVAQLMTRSMGPTLFLAGSSFVLALILGIALGLLSLSKNSLTASLCQFVIISGLSCPSFLWGPILIFVFSFWLNILPPALWLGPQYYILPVLCLALRPLALIARLISVSAQESFSTEYVQVAFSKGLGRMRVIVKHVLRNSLIPLLSIIGTLFTNIITGTFVVELIFAVPGMGHLMVEGVINRDYPVLLALTLFYCFILVIANGAAEIVALSIDPRLRSLKEKSVV